MYVRTTTTIITTITCLFFVALLDDLDKELNNYIMRCREWYGWHFPELSKIVTDNLVYIKTIQTLGQLINNSALLLIVLVLLQERDKIFLKLI